MKHSFILTIAVLLLSIASLAQGSTKYRVAQTFELGGDGGWDYVTFDPAEHRLFIARATRVMVVDASSGKLLSEISDTPGVHGVVLVPDSGRGFISVGKTGHVVAFDLKSLKKLAEINVGENPDAIIYDRSSKRVVVMNGRSKDVTFIDPEKMTAIGTVQVGGKPEFAAADEKGTVYVNNEDANEIIALDAHKMSVVARWPLTGCEEPTGLAMDTAHQRLFSVCGNSQMVISDAASHKTLKSLPIGAGADGVVYDAGRKAIVSSNGEGTITVVQQQSADEYSTNQTLPTYHGARTIALDPNTGRLYLITATFGETPAASAEQPHPRAPITRGTFRIIVCEPVK